MSIRLQRYHHREKFRLFYLEISLMVISFLIVARAIKTRPCHKMSLIGGHDHAKRSQFDRLCVYQTICRLQDTKDRVRTHNRLII